MCEQLIKGYFYNCIYVFHCKYAIRVMQGCENKKMVTNLLYVLP